MSVLIKGMEMPTNCWFCSVKSWDDDEYVCPFSGHTVKSGDAGANRHEDCPLIEIPYHGDLIDKNRMIDVLHTGRKCVSELQKGAEDEKSISFCQGAMVGYTDSIVALDGAPVIIPSEKGSV